MSTSSKMSRTRAGKACRPTELMSGAQAGQVPEAAQMVNWPHAYGRDGNLFNDRRGRFHPPGGGFLPASAGGRDSGENVSARRACGGGETAARFLDLPVRRAAKVYRGAWSPAPAGPAYAISDRSGSARQLDT